MSDYQLICENCLAENELRIEIAERGAEVEKCSLCGRFGGKALPCNDERVKRIFRALVRLNFSEPEYNGHLGGDHLQSVVEDSRAIFDLGPGASGECFEDAFLVLEEDWYPNDREQISLGGGYWDGGVLWGLRELRDLKVEELLRQSLTQNYFEVEATARSLLRGLRPYVEQTLAEGSEWFRGRIGVQKRLRKKEWSSMRQTPLFSYLPYTGKDIAAPPMTRVTSGGRLNRANVSIMYVASDASTAMAELRPHPGHLITTAKFRVQRDLVIANFAHHDIRGYLSDDKLEVLRAILSLADVLNLPVQPDQQHLYAATQLLSDAIRLEGFDGVMFESSLASGKNLACFDPSAFALVDGSEEAFDVKHLSYGFEGVEAQASAYDKEKFEPDESEPLANLVHGLSRRPIRR